MRRRLLLRRTATQLASCSWPRPTRCSRTLSRRLASSFTTAYSRADVSNSSIRLSPPHPTLESAAAPAVQPVGVDEFTALLARAGVPPTQRLAVGLSGGADSSALALLAHHEAQHSGGRRPPPLLLQIDHQLRAESAAETAHCACWLARLTPPASAHVVLPLQWTDGRPPANRLQEVARDRRRAVLVSECERRRVRWLLLAHHSGDQLETIVHRWTRGSGLYGLTGMALARTVRSEAFAQPVHSEDARVDKEDMRSQRSDCTEVVLCRPLLSVSKARLMATCQQYGVRWVEDVSNNNRAFERIRIRQALDAMLDQHNRRLPLPAAPSAASAQPLQPLNAAVLASVPAILASCRQSVDDATTSLLRRHATLVSPFCVAFLSASAATLPFSVLLLLFSRLLAVVRGSAHLPMGEPLPRLVRALVQQRRSDRVQEDVVASRRQAFGCVVSSLRRDAAGKHGGWMVTRALEQANEVIVRSSPDTQRLRWDDRFLVQLRLSPASLRAPAGHDSVQYVLRTLREADLSQFQLPRRSSTCELRLVLLTGLPLLVRRWTSGAGESGEDAVVLPHMPSLPMKDGVRRNWSEAEWKRRAGEEEIQATVRRLAERVESWDWTQSTGHDCDAYKQP